MNASFAKLMPQFGNIAFISQSGALCSSVLDYAREYNLGFSKFMSIGNKATTDEVALLEYFAQDPQTKVIAMYVEQLENAQRFIDVAKKVGQSENPKPIVILKSGRSSEGAAAIASHTGSLAGGDAAYQTLFRQSGVIRANTIRELFEFVDVLSHNPLTPVERVAIITNAGGPVVITTDEVVASGLKLAELSESTQQQLKAFLPAAASVKNPVDILGDAKADRYREALRVLATDENVDAIMVLLTPQTMTEVEETAKSLVDFRITYKKPLVASFMGKESVDGSIQLMERGHVSTTSFPELGIRGLAALGKFMDWSKKAVEEPFAQLDGEISHATQVLHDCQAAQVKNLPEATSLQVFEAYQLPTLHRSELRSEEDAQKAAQEFTSAVALKIISPDILHKSDVGGVKLHVQPDQIAQEYVALLERVKKNVPEARLEGVLAVEMAPADGIELIVGAKKVAGLGTMVMVGLGGVYVEVFKDTSFGYAPLSRDVAQEMLEQLRSFVILQGARGSSGYDIDALIDVLGKVSQLVTDHPEIAELDINPLLILPKGRGGKVLDARIML